MSDYDARLFLLVNSLQGFGPADSFFVAMSWLGEGWLAIPLCVVFVALRHGRRAVRLIALCAVAALLIAGAGYALKEVLARARPVALLGDAARVLGPRLDAHSMPSGHTLLAFMLLGFLLPIERRLAIAWLPFALLVAISRVYVGAHFPSDVIVGGALGFLPAWAIALWSGRALREENR